MGVWIIYSYKGNQCLGVAIEQGFSNEAKAKAWIESNSHPAFRYVAQYFPIL